MAPPSRRALRLPPLAALADVRLWLLMGCWALAILLIAYPLALLFLRSVLSDSGNLSWSKYVAVIKEPGLLSALWNTVIIATGTTLLSTVIGVALAWIHARTNTPGRRALETLNLLPFFLSPFVGAIAWTHLANPRVGLLNQLARWALHRSDPVFNVYTRMGIIWALSVFLTPVVMMFTSAALRRIDASLEEAARIAGAGQLRIFRRVTGPLVMPAILSAAVFTFVGAAGSFDVPLALGNPVGINTLSLAIFQRVADYPADYGEAAALSAILFLMSGAWIVTQRRYVRSRDFTTVTGKGLRTVLIDLGRWRWVALGCNLAYIGVAVLLPLLVLVVISAQKYWAGRVDLSLLTWSNYDFVLVQYDISRRALINSFALAMGGATLGVLFALLLSQVIFRSRFATRAALDLLTTAPIAVPGIVLAMGILLGWLRTPIYGTLFILLIAYVAIYVPLAQRSIASVVLNISTDFEECARVTGASWLYTLRRIVVPLVRPGIVSGWLILFIIFMRELGASILLYQAGTEVMSVALYLLQIKYVTAAAAFAVVQTGILLVLILTLQRLLGGREVLG